MRVLGLTLGLLLAGMVLTEPLYTQPIKPGDTIFVYGRFICWSEPRIIDWAPVMESGQVKLSDGFRLSVVGLRPNEVTTLLKDAVEARTGNRPTSLQVVLAPSEDERRLNFLILEFARKNRPEDYDCEHPSKHHDVPLGADPRTRDS